MSDYLVELGTKPAARKAIKMLGLPIPMPQKLKRNNEPWEERPLEDSPALVCHTHGSDFAELISRTLAAAGADSSVIGDDATLKSYRDHGEAWGRYPKVVNPGDIPDLRPNILLFDASGMKQPSDLKGMYQFFHDWIRKLSTCGRAIVISRPPEQAKTPSEAACAQAVNGFVRSMAREVGKKGSTAQSLYVDSGAEKHTEPVLRFLLSSRSAYISAQPVHVSCSIPIDSVVPYRRPLDGKTALVTGAARGIGASTAKALAREGAHVIGLDRPAENGALSKLMDELGGTMILGDLLDDGAPKKIADEIKKKFKGLDIVVHNAGVTRDKTLANMDDSRWDMTLGVNLIALIELNEKLLPIMKKGSRMICLASIAGIAGNMGQTNYAASKAGVIGYVRALAPKLHSKGVSINAIAPGFIETQMTAAIPFATREGARRLCNLSQGGLPEDIGELVTFLASPGSAGINGEVIRICGGNYVGA